MGTGVELAVNGVCKSFGGRRALDHMTFRAGPGRVTGLLGPNGAGKTTCLRALVGLLAPDDGEALVGGVPYGRLTRAATVVGVSLEGSGFHPWRTGRAHLRLHARAVGVPVVRVDAMLDQVGLTEAAGRRVGGYSLGMRQRLSLAHALLAAPAALVLDEPTNGLDPTGVRWLRDVLQAEAARGATVLVSSHMLAEMEHVVSHIVIVGAGRTLAVEPLAALRDRAQSAVELATPDPERALAALTAAGLVAQQHADRVRVTGVGTAEVLTAALARGVQVDDVRVEESSLEQAYFAVLADGTGGADA